MVVAFLSLLLTLQGLDGAVTYRPVEWHDTHPIAYVCQWHKEGQGQPYVYSRHPLLQPATCAQYLQAIRSWQRLIDENILACWCADPCSGGHGQLEAVEAYGCIDEPS